MKMRAWAVLAALSAAGCATANSDPKLMLQQEGEARLAAHEDPLLEHLAWPTLERFGSEAEFVRYLRDLEAARDRAMRSAGLARGMYAQIGDVPCPEGVPCPEASDDGEQIIVTGSRISSPSLSSTTPITNTQEAGVDEGDIVKMYGRFLIILQDGRLFTIDTGTEENPALEFVARADVYRTGVADTWYDEMLVHENRVLVTGFNYDVQATELSVFVIGENGSLTREAVYFVSSSDYYDTENYATRLVDGMLVIYTPISLEYHDPDADKPWPLVRRWIRTEEGEDIITDGEVLFDARTIYRPLQRTYEPWVHTLSFCDLGGTRPGDELQCRSTAIVGPRHREFYVSERDAFLWISPSGDDLPDTWSNPDLCATVDSTAFESGPPALLLRMPLSGADPRAMHVRGAPLNQFSLDADGETFRALVVWDANNCAEDGGEPLTLRYFSTRLDAFRSGEVATGYSQSFTPVPATDPGVIEIRFTDTHLVYGARERWSFYRMNLEDSLAGEARVVALPIGRPRDAVELQAPHDVLRIEQAGPYAVLTGYHNRDGLSVSVLDLLHGPRIADTAVLADRFESEGRSHAFNSYVTPDGAGLLGLPTVERVWESGRWAWRSDASDVSFLSVAPGGALASIGALAPSEDQEHETYECEVSCVDWYGNSRPIFAGDRVFALSGTELIEGVVRGGKIMELRRVNISAPPPAAMAAR